MFLACAHSLKFTNLNLMLVFYVQIVRQHCDNAHYSLSQSLSFETARFASDQISIWDIPCLKQKIGHH